MNGEIMKKNMYILSVMGLMTALLAVIVQAKAIRDAIWCDAKLLFYRT